MRIRDGHGASRRQMRRFMRAHPELWRNADDGYGIITDPSFDTRLAAWLDTEAAS